MTTFARQPGPWRWFETPDARFWARNAAGALAGVAIGLLTLGASESNLAEILENLSRVIRERAGLMLKVRALSSEGRITALMLTLLPVLTFVGLFFLNPRFYLDVADDPAFMPGFIGLIVLYAIGFWMIRRMVDLKV